MKWEMIFSERASQQHGIDSVLNEVGMKAIKNHQNALQEVSLSIFVPDNNCSGTTPQKHLSEIVL